MTEFKGQLISARSRAAEQDIILKRLATVGYHMPSKGTFTSLVRLYQSQHTDVVGNPLHVDGIVGRATWETLFGAVDEETIATGLAGRALEKARSQVGVREKPLGSNRGTEVDAYQIAAGLTLTPGREGNFWCMAFVYWCFLQVAEGVNPFPKTASVLDAWRKVSKRDPGRIVTREQALADPSLVKPGAVFILDHGGGLGHTGFVSSVTGTALKTIEGNANDGSDPNERNGVGVFRLNRRRTTSEQLKGFIDFTGA